MFEYIPSIALALASFGLGARFALIALDDYRACRAFEEAMKSREAHKIARKIEGQFGNGRIR